MNENSAFRGPFLFINKKAQDFKSRSAEEAFAIGSHVSGRYTRWTRVARIQQSHLVDTSPPDSSLLDADSTTPQKSSSESHRSTGRPLRVKPVKRSPDGTSTRSDGYSPHEPKPLSYFSPSGRLHPQSVPASPLTLLKEGNSDPFSSAAVPITSINHYLINMWKNVFLEAVWPSEARSCMAAVQVWSADSKAIIENETRLHALLAWTTALQITSMPKSDARAKLSLKAMTHKSRCLKALQRDLSLTKTTTAMIPIVWHLTGTELYSGDVDTAMIHLNALMNMVEISGGLLKLPWAVQKLIIIADMTLCQVRMQHSSLPVEIWDPGSITKTGLLSPSQILQLAYTPFIANPMHPEVPNDSRDIFYEYKELLAVQEIASTISIESKRTDVLCWAQLRSYALSVKITNKRADLASDDTSSGVSLRALERCALLAVDYSLQLYWQRHHKSRTKLAPFHHPFTDDADLLDGITSTPNLALWITYIASVVDEICGKPDEEKANHRIFLSLASKLHLQVTLDVRSVLTQFLYQEESLDPYLYALFPGNAGTFV